MGGILRPLPLSLVPLVLYALGAFYAWDFGSANGDGEAPSFWDGALLELTLVSGASFTLRIADGLVALAGLMLLASVLRARLTAPTVLANMLSIIVLGAYVVTFIVADFAATSVFFTLCVLAFVDTVATIVLAMSVRRRSAKPAAQEGARHDTAAAEVEPAHAPQ